MLPYVFNIIFVTMRYIAHQTNSFQSRLIVYQMYLFRRCHCIPIASILSSWPLPSPMMRYIAHRFFIIHSSLRPLFCFCLSERFLYQRKLMRGCWIFKDLIKNGLAAVSSYIMKSCSIWYGYKYIQLILQFFKCSSWYLLKPSAIIIGF